MSGTQHLGIGGGEEGAPRASASVLDRELERVRGEIEDVQIKITRIEEEIETAKSSHDEKEVERLSRREEQLREEKNLLRQEQLELLRQKGEAERRVAVTQSASVGVPQDVPGSEPAWFAALKGELGELGEKLGGELGEIKASVNERLSASRQASKISRSDLEAALAVMKLRVLRAQDSPSLDALFEPDIDEDTPGFWGPEPEPQQREAYADEFRKRLPRTRGPGQLQMTPARLTVEFRQEGLAFPIRGRTDELVVPRRLEGDGVLGAVIGLEFKKQLAPGDLLQAQAEWLLYAPKSMFPYVQLLTDMEHGGVAFYYVRGELQDGWRRLEYRVLPSMDDLWSFVAHLVQHIPPDIACDTADGSSVVQPLELPEPKRFKFDALSQASMVAAWRALATFQNNLHDVANLDDLRGFGLDDTPPRFGTPSYIS